MPNKIRPKHSGNGSSIWRHFGLNRTGSGQTIIVAGPFIGTFGHIRVDGTRKHWRWSRKAQSSKSRKRPSMKIEGPNFRFVAILEAPTWVLLTVAVLVTISVIVTAMDVI